MINDCHHLDAWLDGELAPADDTRFAAHLEQCAACREAVDEQQWIDGLLRSPLLPEIEAPRAALVERIHRRTNPRYRPTRLIACGLAAAAALLIAVGWIALYRFAAKRPAIQIAADPAVARENQPDADPVQSETPDELLPTRSVFVGGPQVIVVPVASQASDVTVVRIYPTYQADFAANRNVESPAESDESAWSDFNGG